MGNLIVKSNDFIGASYGVGLSEQRLVLLAILRARESSDEIGQIIGKTITIHASDYMKHFGTDRHAAYESLRNGVNGLFESEYRYTKKTEKGNNEVVRCRFVQEASYVDDEACVRLIFANNTVPLIVGLSKNFTQYEIEQVANLQSIHALRLYELLCQWRENKEFYISMQDLRFKFSIKDDEYTRIDNFKRKVLDFAINEINKNTDLEVSYTQQKQGRVITGFTFSIKQKKKIKEKRKSDKKENQRDDKTIDMLSAIKMTDKQRSLFASKLSELHECSQLPYGTESYEALARWIEQDLLKPERAGFYRPLLEKVGFKGD